MSILVNKDTRLLVQGLTGNQGQFHTAQMLAYGTNVVAGATPGRGGQTFQGVVPVYDEVEEAVAKTRANASVIFVPAPNAADAVLEAADVGVKLIVCITEGVPALDMVKVLHYLRENDVTLIGPNCPGVISPGQRCRVGIMPSEIHLPGRVGVASRSGTLTYEAVYQLTQAGIGQSTCVGIGGDPLVGTNFVEALALFQDDPQTDAVVLIGEIGGIKEQQAAEFIRAGGFKKPLYALVAGQSAPPGKRMGHAGAIITGTAALASSKIAALREAGATIIPGPAYIGDTVRRGMG
ncbi:MAG: succinate--CoA ligase subunit alpha [Chloroflexi bacterium]|nr:succinate--CoA ligase subunit alpha [Chloroflexota bacterium]